MEKLVSTVAVVLFLAALILLGGYALGGPAEDRVRVAEQEGYGTGGLIYSGSLKNGLMDGLGEMVFPDGQVYKGNFKDGRFHGDGLYGYRDEAGGNSWRFEGLFEDGRARSGILHLSGERSMIVYMHSPESDTLIGPTWRYLGGFDARGQNGEGTFTYLDGSSYAGGFKNGLAEGEGRYADARGETIYAGGFKGGRFEGKGVYCSPEGWIYEGEFKEGLFDGEGMVKNGALAVRGLWKKGKQTKLYE